MTVLVSPRKDHSSLLLINSAANSPIRDIKDAHSTPMSRNIKIHLPKTENISVRNFQLNWTSTYQVQFRRSTTLSACLILFSRFFKLSWLLKVINCTTPESWFHFYESFCSLYVDVLLWPVLEQFLGSYLP